MKNLKGICVVFALFMLAVPVIGSSACSVSPPVTPPTGEKIVVKQSGGAGLLIKECSDSSYITQTADYIVEGTVEKVESTWDEAKTGIFTYTDLRIENYVKGAPFEGDEIQIVTPGGTVGDISQWVEDQPILHEGTKVRIYFEQENGEYAIVCGHFGVQER
jgi:hypothetical protein